MDVPALTNISNLAAFGVEWTHADSGNRYQLSNIKGVMSLMFGAHVNGKWHSTRVVDPSRFMDSPPKTFKEFRAVAERYIGE